MEVEVELMGVEMEAQNRLNENLDSIPACENDSLRTAKCWRCQKGIDEKEIIRLCQCTDIIQFVHVKCLKKSVNSRSIYYCRICDTSLPLIRKSKSSIEWCTNETTLKMLKVCCVSIFKMLILILFKISLVILINYLIAYLDVSKIGKFIPVLMIVLVLFALLLFPIYHEFHLMLSWIMSVRECCYKWYESNQELQLDSIQVYRTNEV